MKAKLIVTDDKGQEVVVETDLGKVDMLRNINSIEKVVVSLKHILLPRLEQELLEKVDLSDAQHSLIKKKWV